jgi:membrane fusion protein, heavy metal efflux system
MKKVILITGTLLLAATVVAQEPDCDCADCREKAAAAAAGKEFTLPGLRGLNNPLPHDEHDAHAEHEHSNCGAASHDEHEADEHIAQEAGHEEHGRSTEEVGHEGHDHGDDAEEGIELTAEMIKKTGLQILEAGSGTVTRSSTFPAEIQLNRDRTSAVSPRYPSVVRRIFAEIGDEVKKGDVLASLENRETLAVYTVSAPLDGVIIRKDLAAGETAGEDDVLFEVADLSSVWANINIFPQYRHLLRKDMQVTFVAHDGHTAQGAVKYISPIVSNETRTFIARCVLEGAGEDFTPGAFVRARMVMDQTDAPVVVPRVAVQVIEGESVVFIAEDHGFVATPVQVGLADDAGVEIRSGLKPGDRYVAAGAFALKAQIITSGMDPHAGHGH